MQTTIEQSNTAEQPPAVERRSSFADGLRGFALVGICVVNLPFMAVPVASLLATPTGAEAAAQFTTSLLFEGKFFLLFSFLFGFGFAVHMRRIADGRATPASFGRRLVGLGFLGILHAVLLFPGDILLAYAALGGVLWAVRHWSDERLIKLAWRLGLVSLVAFALLALIMATLGAVEPESARADSEAALAAYRGSFGTALERRLQDWELGLTVIALFNAPLALAAFCVGLVAGRRGLLDEPARLEALLRPRLPLLAAAAAIGNGAAALFPWLPGWLGVLAFPLLALGAPTLSALYVFALARLARDRRGERALAFLAPAGRMSLTNYLGQSLVANALFMGWGFGLYGHLGRPALFGIALAIALTLIALSRPWLTHLASGPDEWLLRSWTALRWQPFRRRAERVAPDGVARDRRNTTGRRSLEM